jgi:hypothetical protein
LPVLPLAGREGGEVDLKSDDIDSEYAWLILLGFCGLCSISRCHRGGKFSAEAVGNVLPAGWNPLTFKKIEKHTVYSLVEDGGVAVVKARSEASASGLTREMKIDPREYPLVQWRWKVSHVLKKGNLRTKEGDDYPARIYITFEYDPSKLGFFEKAKYGAVKLLYGQYPPLGAINYIWESKAPIGTIVPNPYTDRAMMIVVESDEAKLNQWVSEERNVYEDYKKAFGTEPPMISGVAIMTDTDNTGETATAYYGILSSRRQALAGPALSGCFNLFQIVRLIRGDISGGCQSVFRAPPAM